MLPLLLPSLALAARWDSVPDDTADSLCGSKNPQDGYVYYVGFDKHRDHNAAYSVAELKLLDASGYTGYRRDALRRRIRDWSRDSTHGRTVCVRLEVPRAALDSLDQDGAAFDQALQELATRLQAQGPLQLTAPRWSTGCIAHLAELVQDRVLGLLPGAIEGHDDPNRHTVTLRFSADKKTATLTPMFDGASFGNRIDFPLDVLALDPTATLSCATNETLGLTGDSAARSDGLTVSIDLAHHEGTACDGDRDTLVATTNRAARVQFYSVSKSGLGNYLGAFEVNGRQELGSGTWVVPPEEGDERLIAVAGEFGLTANWEPGCRLREPWSRTWFGSDLAVGTETYLVQPQGGVCPTLAGPAKQERDDAVARRDGAPWCR